MPQCAFKVSMLNVSAIHISSRIWLRSSSTHEPSRDARMDFADALDGKDVAGRRTGELVGAV
jgi:hypothetical protein